MQVDGGAQQVALPLVQRERLLQRLGGRTEVTGVGLDLPQAGERGREPVVAADLAGDRDALRQQGPRVRELAPLALGGAEAVELVRLLITVAKFAPDGQAP